MTQDYICDICGHSEKWLQVDEDGLYLCNTCRRKLKTRPVGNISNSDLGDKLQFLVGKSAGAICRTLELPLEPPYDIVIEAASRIAYDQDLYMSAWFFVTQWLDGTTIWRDPDGHKKATVTSDGNVNIILDK